VNARAKNKKEEKNKKARGKFFLHRVFFRRKRGISGGTENLSEKRFF
jgi:hypothetical protein